VKKHKIKEKSRRSKKEKGITLIALVITIIVLLILAGVSIAMLTEDNGVIKNAKESKLATTFSTYKEEVNLYKTNKYAENMNFLENTLEASKSSLLYNTKKQDEEGNIKDIITTINNDDMEKFEIIKGNLLINTKDLNEIKVAQSLGIQVNPYDITEEGELLSSDGNLLLVDETGTLKIPDTVTKIGEGAFAEVEGLKTIIIPGSVKEIGTRAFAYNPTLETVIMEEGVEIIGQSAFSGCVKLKNISMPESLIKIESSCFSNTVSLEKIKIPSKVNEIRGYVFNGAINLKSIILSENTEKISQYALADTGIEEIVLPEKIKEIYSNAFSFCSKLNNIIIEGENPQFIYESGMLMTKNKENIIFISDKYLNNINTFEIPDGITRFEINISKYTNIEKINIPETIEYILPEYLPTTINEIKLASTNKTYAINENKKILYTKDAKKVVICYSKEENIDLKEEDILSIGVYAFKPVINAKNIILPDSLEEIGQQAFSNCKKVEEIKIGANVTDIHYLFKYKNYSGKVTIHAENPNYIIEDNVLYNKNKTELCTVLSEIKGEFNVNENVKEIGKLAFHAQAGMTKINLPKGLKKISNSFNYCNGLNEINIPSTVETIDIGAFNESKNLNSINIDKTKDSIQGAPWGAIKGMRIINWKK